MFFAAKIDPTRLWPRPGEGPVEYWTSLSPMAPFFGVTWRFADLEADAPAPRRASKPKRSPIRKDAVDAEVVTAPTKPVAAKPAAPKPAPAKPEAAAPKAKPAAPAKAEPVKAEAPKPEASKAETVKAEPAKAEPVKAAPVKAEPAKAEPVKDAPKPAASPAPKTAADDLTLLKGVGPKMAANLKAQGVTSFADIAAWDDAKIDQMDEALGGLPGRIRRDDWVGQAKALLKG